jgi:hypothetical protein
LASNLAPRRWTKFSSFATSPTKRTFIQAVTTGSISRSIFQHRWNFTRTFSRTDPDVCRGAACCARAGPDAGIKLSSRVFRTIFPGRLSRNLVRIANRAPENYCCCCCCWSVAEVVFGSGRLLRRTMAGGNSSGCGASTGATVTRTLSSLSASPLYTPRVGGTSA